MSSASDFVIENGVLIKYVGPGGDVVVPEGVTEIGEKAFCIAESVNNFGIVYESVKDNTTLTGVSLPEGLVRIGAYAFESCVTLAGVTLPQSVKSIDQYAFVHCKALKTVICKEGSLREIGESAFSYCSSLTSVTIPTSVTSIGNGAFSCCFGLKEITIPEKVTNIGGRAFDRCTGIKEITIPESVTNIGGKAFDGCERLRKVTCLGSTPPTIGSNSFPNRSNQTLYVPKGCKSIYEDADFWWEFKEIIEQGSSQHGTKYDVNGDGDINITDALVIINIILGRE